MTLLEVLAVLTLLGLTMSMSLPRMESVYNSLQLSFGIDEFSRGIQNLPDIARDRQSAMRIEAMSNPVIKDVGLIVPSGWQARVYEPIRISQQGLCLGGGLVLSDGRSNIRFEVKPPFCRLERLGGVGG